MYRFSRQDTDNLVGTKNRYKLLFYALRYKVSFLNLQRRSNLTPQRSLHPNIDSLFGVPNNKPEMGKWQTQLFIHRSVLVDVFRNSTRPETNSIKFWKSDNW